MNRQEVGNMPECHDCRCHFNPPCSACERCVHIDQTVCPEDCQTCEYDHERTGPYRLLDGTWSDGVDRTVPLYGSDYNLRNPKRLAVTLVRDTGQWRAAIKRSRKGKRFDTHTEAIAYADTQARGK